MHLVGHFRKFALKLNVFSNFKIPVLSIEFAYGVVTINDFNRAGILMLRSGMQELYSEACVLFSWNFGSHRKNQQDATV
jgi:hypothetical protein